MGPPRTKLLINVPKRPQTYPSKHPQKLSSSVLKKKKIEYQV